MNVNWFKNPNNIEYISVDDFITSFKKDIRINNLKNQIEEFRENPRPEGKVIFGGNQTSLKLFSPKLMFKERIEKDENVWVYLGENYPSYCLDKTEPWRDKAYFFFSHKDCEFYPCHETKDPDNFNCLFCFCPLYCLGSRCGGNYNYYGDIKDCSKCMIPHLQDSYGYIMSKFNDVVEAIK